MLARALLVLVNHLLDQSEWARRRLLPHAGQVALLRLPMAALHLTVTDDGHLEAVAGGGEPDLTLTVSGEAVAAAVGGSDAAMKHVHVAGNADFGEALGFVLRNLDWDAEADLARLLGDGAAPRVHRTLLGVLAWHRQTLERAGENLRDYLVLERPVLVSASAVQDLAGELTGFLDDLARLEKRVARGEAALVPPTKGKG
jgi:ubiquinone biosynthesis protein UbiJ